MFKKLAQPSDLGKVLRGLDQNSTAGIFQSGPIFGVLKISLGLSKDNDMDDPSSPINCFDFVYYYWKNFDTFLMDFIEDQSFELGFPKDKWIKEITNFASKKEYCYCICLALFLDHHMRNSYNSLIHTHKKVMHELEQITSGNIQLPDYKNDQETSIDKLDIYVTMHAGKRPFIQVNFSTFTINNYQEFLEDICTISVLNIIKISLSELQEPYRTLLEDLIFNQHLIWQKGLPKLLDLPSWKWLPEFL